MKSLAIEDLVARELKNGIESLGELLPSLKYYIAPVFHVANELQSTVGQINIKEDKYSTYGIWKTIFLR